MKLVNEINSSVQVAVGGKGTYAKRVSPEPAKFSPGFPVSIAICPCPLDGAPPEEHRPIHIEGDAACILDAMYQTIEQLLCLGAAYVKESDLDPAWQDRAKALQEKWQQAAEATRQK